MGFLDALATPFKEVGETAADVGRFVGTEVVTPKNLLTAAGGVTLGPLGAGAGRALGESTFGDDWGWRGEDAAQGFEDALMSGAKGYGYSQLGSFAADKAGGLFGGGEGVEAAGSGMMRDATQRGIGETGSAFADTSMGSQAAADQLLGEVPDLGAEAAGSGATSYASAVGGSDLAAEPIYNLSNAAESGGDDLFGTGLSLEEGMLGAQALGTLGNAYGAYKQGQLADERRKRRRRVMSAFMPLMKQRMAALSG